MNTQTSTSRPVEPDGKWMFRVGGLSALAIALAYLAIMALYIPIGAPPEGGEEWLKYGAGKTTTWWGILGLSVMTDILILPVWMALFLALRGIHRDAMLVAASMKGLFVALELAAVWPNFGALIEFSGNYAAATTEAQRVAYVTAANYAATVAQSSLGSVYAILLPAVGMLIAGVVMLRGGFSRSAGYAGVASGVLGIVAVVGPFFLGGLDKAVILASLLSLVWYFVVGYRLFQLGRR